MEDQSKRIGRADGIQAVREFISRQTASGVLGVTFKPLSLICPIMKKRIVHPARGVNCNHMECFDLSAYLGSQISKPFWECPVCSKPLPAAELRTYEFMSYVLRDELVSVRSVEVLGDGTCRATEPSECGQVNGRQLSHQAEPADAITLDDEPMIVDNDDEEAH
ncbi:MIZ zinc finger family protein [Aphelenchoides avenae]|nr:MIZ zinc finger family protein [Aphelenchus avenae]